MKIILLDVSSIDGKITKGQGNDISEWSSVEDFEHFSKVREENNLLVMGSGTFEAVHPQPEKERLRIVLTSRPKKYEKFFVSGQIEFTNKSPKMLVNQLEKQGYKQMLLVGGGRVATAFLRENLVDELWITIEPKIFGIGEPLVTSEKMDIDLQLFELKKLNERGTLLLKYKIL